MYLVHLIVLGDSPFSKELLEILASILIL